MLSRRACLTFRRSGDTIVVDDSGLGVEAAPPRPRRSSSGGGGCAPRAPRRRSQARLRRSRTAAQATRPIQAGQALTSRPYGGGGGPHHAHAQAQGNPCGAASPLSAHLRRATPPCARDPRTPRRGFASACAHACHCHGRCCCAFSTGGACRCCCPRHPRPRAAPAPACCRAAGELPWRCHAPPRACSSSFLRDDGVAPAVASAHSSPPPLPLFPQTALRRAAEPAPRAASSGACQEVATPPGARRMHRLPRGPDPRAWTRLARAEPARSRPAHCQKEGPCADGSALATLPSSASWGQA